MSENQTEDFETIVFAGPISPVLLAVREKLKEEPKYRLLEEAVPQLLPDFVKSVSPALVLMHVVDLNQLAENVMMARLLVDLVKTRNVRVVLFSGKLPDKIVAVFEKAGVRDFVPESTPVKNIAFKISRLSAALAQSKKQGQGQEEKRVLGQVSERTGSEIKMKEWALLKPRDALPFAIAASELMSQSDVSLDEACNKMGILLGSVLGPLQMEIWCDEKKLRVLKVGNPAKKILEIENWDQSWTGIKNSENYVVAPFPNRKGTGIVLYGEMAAKLPPPFTKSLLQAFEGLVLSHFSH